MSLSSPVGTITDFWFYPTGDFQSFIVPEHDGNIRIDLVGGGGMYGYPSWPTGARGGRGGRIRGEGPFAAGTELRVLVGYTYMYPPTAQSIDAAGRGGYGYGWSPGTTYSTGNGGEATDIRLGGTTLAHRILVAGGGGGGGPHNGSPGGSGGVGVAAGATGGGGYYVGVLATGGTLVGPGTGGNSWITSPGYGPGDPGNGADGGNGVGGSGGGGGYFGGGGGGYNGAGGGGSSWGDPTYFDVLNGDGFRVESNALITMDFLGPWVPPVGAGPRLGLYKLG